MSTINKVKNYIFPIITTIVALSSGVSFYKLPQIVYYGYFAVLSIYFLFFSRNIKLNLSISIFICIGAISILVNDISNIFSPWLRLIIFIAIITPISSLINSRIATIFRVKLFKIFILTISILIILSFIGYLSGLSFFYHTKTNTFRGLIAYCMLLSPYAGISCLYFIAKSTKEKHVINIILAILSFLVCLIAGSRGGFVATSIAALYFIITYWKNNKRVIFRATIIILTFTIALGTILSPYMENIEKKQVNNIESGGSTFYSREALFKDRILEFYSNPIFGSGFASVNKDIAKKTSISNDGTVEPGSSWLFILSSMGIFAFIIILKLTILPVTNIFINRNKFTANEILIASIMVLFIIHMIVEGYILSAGSFLFFGAWLTIGMLQKESLTYLKNENYSIL